MQPAKAKLHRLELLDIAVLAPMFTVVNEVQLVNISSKSIPEAYVNIDKSIVFKEVQLTNMSEIFVANGIEDGSVTVVNEESLLNISLHVVTLLKSAIVTVVREVHPLSISDASVILQLVIPNVNVVREEQLLNISFAFLSDVMLSIFVKAAKEVQF